MHAASCGVFHGLFADSGLTLPDVSFKLSYSYSYPRIFSSVELFRSRVCLLRSMECCASVGELSLSSSNTR